MKKKKLFGVITIITAVLAITAFKGEKEDLIVHEWGTFTTLHGSNGCRLSGLFLEEEQLPSFVHQLDYSYNAGKGFPESVSLSNVTVKMETPVIYFYSDKSIDVDVSVNFPNGVISQWYPVNEGGNNRVTKSSGYGTLDLRIPYNDLMSWKVKVLPSGEAKQYSSKKELETKTWTSPRATDANLIESKNGDVEKFIFYRGLADFSIPVETKFVGDNMLTVKNTGKEKIPFVFVYEKNEAGVEKLWWSGTMESNAIQNIDLSKNAEPAVFDKFEKALVSAGLYPKEAKSMLATWEASYFKKPGLRVFWIVPETEVNKLLPLKITPSPTETKRVFVGRCDVLTPGFEKKLLNGTNTEAMSNLYNPRYKHGYEERVRQLKSK